MVDTSRKCYFKTKFSLRNCSAERQKPRPKSENELNEGKTSIRPKAELIK